MPFRELESIKPTVEAPTLALAAAIYGGWLAGLRAGGTTGWEKYAGRVLASPPEHAQAEPQAAHAADDNVVDADFKEVKKS